MTANPEEIAQVIAKVFANEVSPVQVALLLYSLSITGLEQDPEVLAECATVMRAAAENVDKDVLRRAIHERSAGVNAYEGGLVGSLLMLLALHSRSASAIS